MIDYIAVAAEQLITAYHQYPADYWYHCADNVDCRSDDHRVYTLAGQLLDVDRALRALDAA